LLEAGSQPLTVQSVFRFTQDLFKYLLPHGIPRNSLVVMAGEGGSGKSVILVHLVKDFLLAGEPVIYVALDDDPQTVLSQLLSFGIDARAFCEKKQLVIIDGFSYLAKLRRQQFCVEEEVTPENPDTIVSAVSRVVEKYNIADKGLVIIDSLNEIIVILDPTRFVKFVKAIRASFSKSRSILTIVTLHTSTESFKEYLLTVEHLVDGVLETGSIPGELAQQLPIFVRQISVKKMKGVDSKPGWILYGIDHEGLKPVMLRITGPSKQ